MEHLHLFTPVGEGLPEITGWYICMYFNGTMEVLNFYQDRFEKQPSFKTHMGHTRTITHWLDLSKLTTKKKAEIAFNFIISEKYMLNDVDLLEKCRTIL